MNAFRKLLLIAVTATLAACGGGGDNGVPTGLATLQTITVAATPPNPAAGQTAQLSATGVYSDKTSRLLSNVTWTSSNTAVATVNSILGGQVVTITQGSTNITATFNGVSGTLPLTVGPAVFKSLSLNINGTPVVYSSISQRTQGKFTATVYNTDGKQAAAAGSITWATSNPAVMAVDPTGNFAGVAAGAVTVTAAYNGQTFPTSLTLVTPLATPLVTVTCNAAFPMTLSAKTWNSAFANDRSNSTEWVVVDPTTCANFPTVELLENFGTSSTAISILQAPAYSATVFAPAITRANSFANGDQVVSGGPIIVGWTASPSATTYTPIYTFKASP